MASIDTLSPSSHPLRDQQSKSSFDHKSIALHNPEEPLPVDCAADFPEGGLTAWATVFGAFLIQIGGFGFTTAFGVFQDFYPQHHLTNVSSSTISWIGSTNACLVLSGGLIFGRLYDQGYFYWLIIGGCALQSFCLFMLSLTQSNHFYQVFLCQGLGCGLATSMSYVPSLAVLSHHFKQRRAFAMAVATSGTPVGAVVYTIMLNNLLNGGLGFSYSICITAAITSVVLLIGCSLMRTRLSSKTLVDYSQVLRKSSSDYAYIAASLGLFLFGAGAYFPIFYIQLDSSVHGLGNGFSFYTIVIFNGANAIGRATAGFASAYLGISYTIIGSTLGCSIVTFAMMTLATRAGAALIGIFIGYLSGVYVALSAPLIASLTDDLPQLGARIGISLALAGMGSLIGAPLAGVLLTSNYYWWRPAVFCGCLTLTSTALFILAQLILRRRKQGVTAATSISYD